MSRRLAAVLLILLSGCASFAMGAADRPSLESATLVEACPLGVPWTRMRVTDAANGVMVDFQTSLPSNVDELRRRVRDQSHAYGPDRHRGAGHDGEHGGPRDHGLRLWTMGDLTTRVEDLPAGARLTIAPNDPRRIADVRQRVSQRITHLETAGCSI